MRKLRDSVNCKPQLHHVASLQGSRVYDLGSLGIDLIWFDSLGAKCSSIAITTSRGIVVIDPGVAEMQPSYPLPHHEKLRLREEALHKIESYVLKASIVIVTHYHYDHHVLPSDPMLWNKRLFQSKTLHLKNPNMYINESQWERARL
ncbi:MAG TPA: MBL fold metallo-hydrolase, partial [Ignisphaera aggregans]|nr:MBL fold metallo-hydrolase [Ignisphaera aggregans]